MSELNKTGRHCDNEPISDKIRLIMYSEYYNMSHIIQVMIPINQMSKI